jgi:hypothetical protein
MAWNLKNKLLNVSFPLKTSSKSTKKYYVKISYYD